jgi:hypothetical protein
MRTDSRKRPAGANRRWTAAAVVLGLVALGGCNPALMLAFLFPADTNLPPECPLTVEGGESKVVILTYHAGGGPGSALLSRVDSDLTWRLYQLLQNRFKENKDQVTLVPPNQVRNYQNSRPRWRDESPQKIGKHFKADFVLTLEIVDFRLTDKRNANFMYEGHAEINVTVTDAHKEVGEGEAFSQPYSIDYPRSTPALVGDMSLNQFRAKFIDRIAKELSQMFTPHPPRDKYTTD